jgi:hypothetical protein
MLSLLVLVSGLVQTFQKVGAASLTNVTVTPGSLNTLTTTSVNLTFSPNTAITNGSIIEVSYDTAFTGGASLTDADVNVTGINISSSSESAFSAGFFRSTLTTSGNVTTTVTISIDNSPGLTTPSSAGNYSWGVNIDIGGAGTSYDYGAGLAYIADENEVNIAANVASIISMDLYNAGTNTLMSNPNTCNLGLLTNNAVATCSYNVGVGTNNTAGATINISAGGQLTNGSYNMTQASGSAISAGTEAYGFYISAQGNRFTAQGSYATQHQAVPTSQTLIAQSSQTSDKATTAQHITVTHAATSSTSTPTGSYTQVVAYTAYTR